MNRINLIIRQEKEPIGRILCKFNVITIIILISLLKIRLRRHIKIFAGKPVSYKLSHGRPTFLAD